LCSVILIEIGIFRRRIFELSDLLAKHWIWYVNFETTLFGCQSYMIHTCSYSPLTSMLLDVNLLNP